MQGHCRNNFDQAIDGVNISLSRHSLLKEPLINIGSSVWRDEMARIKAKSARNSQLLRSFSTQSLAISAVTRQFMN